MAKRKPTGKDNLKSLDRYAFWIDTATSEAERAVRDQEAGEKLDAILTAIGGGEFSSESSLVSNQSLSANFNTPSIDMFDFSKGVLVATWSGADANNEATFVIETSTDKTNWNQLGESGIALINESDTQIWQIIDIPARYIRIAYTDNRNTSGTVDINFVGRK